MRSADTTAAFRSSIQARVARSNQADLDRSSAEVITEAPSSQSGVLPLADLGTVTYTSSTDNTGSLGTQNPTEIVMVDNVGKEKDSTTAISAAGSFSNIWLRSS